MGFMRVTFFFLTQSSQRKLQSSLSRTFHTEVKSLSAL